MWSAVTSNTPETDPSLAPISQPLVPVLCQPLAPQPHRSIRDSDDFGRVTGSYTFIDDDPLDQYTLGIPGFHGTAKLTVAENLLMGREPRFVSYVDIPLQHVSANVLKTMRRPGSPEDYRAMVTRMRDLVPTDVGGYRIGAKHKHNGVGKANQLLQTAPPLFAGKRILNIAENRNAVLGETPT